MLKGPGTVLVAAPLAIWVIPIADSMAAIVRRTLDRSQHLRHGSGPPAPPAVRGLGKQHKGTAGRGRLLPCHFVGGAAERAIGERPVRLISGLAVVAMLVVTNLFGRAELRLLLNRFRSVAVSLGDPTDIGGGRTRESTVRLQGSQKWEVLWEMLTESADKLHLARLHLDVNAPALHESYVATWERPDAKPERDRCWFSDLPLSAGPMNIGRLYIHGQRNGDSGLEEIAQVLDLLEPFTARLAALTRPTDASETELANTAQEMTCSS